MMRLVLLVTLLDFPTRLAKSLGISVFAAGLIASFMILMFILLMLVAATKGNPNPFITALLTFFVLAICTAIGWFPVWSLIILMLLIGLLYGKRLIGL